MSEIRVKVMKEKKGNEVKLISSKKLLISASILVFSIVVIGFSLTYAYFTVGYGRKADHPFSYGDGNHVPRAAGGRGDVHPRTGRKNRGDRPVL